MIIFTAVKARPNVCIKRKGGGGGGGVDGVA